MSSQAESIINHFSHQHTMHLSNHQNQQTLTPVSCSGCKLKATGLIYGCTTCNYFLHAKCSKLPQKITHPCHKDHVFTLLPKPYYPEGLFNCDACGEQGKGFSYHCKACSIDLHILCASKPLSFNHQSHNHQLKLIFSPPYPNKIFNCDICHTAGYNHWLYRCEGCQFDVHLNCTNIPVAPATVRQTHTNHSQPTFGAAPMTQTPIPQHHIQQLEMASKSARRSGYQGFEAFGPQHTATGIPVPNFMPAITHGNQGIPGPAMPFAPTQNDLLVLQMLQSILSSQQNLSQQQQYLQALMAGGGLGAGVGAGGFGAGVGGTVNGPNRFPGRLQQFLQALPGLTNIAAGGGIPGLDLFGNGGAAGINVLQGLIGGGDGGLSILGNMSGLGEFLGAFMGS